MKLSKKIFVRVLRVGIVLIVLGAYYKVQHTEKADLVLASGMLLELIGISGWLYYTLNTPNKIK